MNVKEFGILSLLVAGIVLSFAFALDFKIPMFLLLLLFLFVWHLLIKREWNLFALKIKDLLKIYNPRVTFSIIGGTTFLKEPLIPFSKKFLRPSLGASVVYKGVRLRLNFLFFKPKFNPLMLDSAYDYELILYGFSNEDLTNELYALGFKERVLPSDVKQLIEGASAFYMKNEEYAKNPELLINNLFSVLDKHLKP